MNGVSLDRFLNGPFVKTGCCQTAQKGPILKKIWSELFKIKIRLGSFLQKNTESQSDRHPRILSIRVGDICLCLISLNFPTRFARRGIILCVKNKHNPFVNPQKKSIRVLNLVLLGRSH